MREPTQLITKESPRQIIFEDYKIDLPISGGWGYNFETACVIDKNDPTVIKGLPFDGTSVEYVFVEKRIYEEMIIFNQNGGQTNHNIPDPIESWCYNQLPGGWEIDEGSNGEFVFNLIDNDITLNLKYGTQEEITEWVIQESFE